MKQFLILSLLLVTALCSLSPASALDLTQGLMYATPLQAGKAPVIDGDLADWDLSGAEPIWIASQTIRQYHGTVALMYDDNALYVGANISLPGRPLRNPNNPVDAFWWGDVLEFRVAADPNLPAPLNGGVNSNRVAHLTFFKNTDTGKDYLHIAYGVGLDKGHAVNPAGSQLVIKEHGNESYTIEARIPWSALNVPGGKNPFAPGRRMTAVWGIHWGGETQTAALYRQNPGSFAFMQPGTWGQVEFSPVGNLKPRHETLTALIAQSAAPAPQAVGVPFTITVPAEGLKVSINILGPHGEVIRDLMGGEDHPKGKLIVHWDGRDQWGNGLPPGTYRWGAYFSKGLKAEYMGNVGKSGNPPYETADGKGGWGGDHGLCIATAADPTGLYFIWSGSEDGRAVVKTDYSGKVIWRKSPFLAGGFGDYYAATSNGKYLFLTLGSSKPALARLDAATGQLLSFSADGPTAMPISASAMVKAPEASSPTGNQPEAVGIAATGAEVYASVYSQNIIQVLNPETGLPVRTLLCPAPRGLCLDGAGNLYAVSYVPDGAAQVLKFAAGEGTAIPVVTEGLVAPWGVAVDAQGSIYVSDLGASQQIKVFSPNGQVKGTWGKPGGRTWAGTYDGSSFLLPAGLAADSQGGILVSEASAPKVMSRWDARTGKALGRWFGNVGYSAATWPSAKDPWTAYYALEAPTAFARGTIPAPGLMGAPTASWALPQAGVTAVGTMMDGIADPTVLTAANGKDYMVSDTNPHGIALIRGDQMLPVGYAKVYSAGSPTNLLHKNYLELWTDLNGDHQIEPGELTSVETVAGQPLPEMNDITGSMRMEANGDLYLITRANKILKVPAAGFNRNGSIVWAVDKASYAVPAVLASMGNSLFSGWRAGVLGVRRDTEGNLYTAFNTTAPSLTPALQAKMEASFPGLPSYEWGAYATPEQAKAMHEGLGHTGESNAVKFAKYAPDGRLIWMAGRKATAAAAPGEMYHFWVLGGLVGKPGAEYIAGCSEWGQTYFYTHDGFYVDALMNNPGLAPPAGPYTFGSETFGGRVQDFPALDQVWAYQSSYAYRINGFKNGRVIGERRTYGAVKLDKVYDNAPMMQAKTGPLQIVALADPLTDSARWNAAPISMIRRNGEDIAAVQVGYDDNFLYARFHVNDPTPLQNVADTNTLVFKGGDAVGLDLGPAPHHDAPILGDIRLLAARIGGQDRLIAMKPVTNLQKNPQDYYTPSTGHVRFDFVGEVPGGKVILTPDPNGQGYTANFAVPRAFLETTLAPGTTLSADAEVLLSGQGALGVQTLGHSYIFAPANSQTTMINDLPTEARLYPQYWGTAEVK